MEQNATPLVKMENISKSFGKVKCPKKGRFHRRPARKSLVYWEIMEQAKQRSSRSWWASIPWIRVKSVFDGEKVSFTSPKDARAKGIETVYQDLALVELMSILRNFLSRKGTRQRRDGRGLST